LKGLIGIRHVSLDLSLCYFARAINARNGVTSSSGKQDLPCDLSVP